MVSVRGKLHTAIVAWLALTSSLVFALAPDQSNLIDMNFDKETDIRIIADFLSRRLGKNILIDPEVNGKVRILSPKKVSKDLAYEIFLIAMDQTGFSAVETPILTKIMKKQAALTAGHAVFYGKDYTEPKSEIVTLVMPLDHLPAKNIRTELLKFTNASSLLIHEDSNSLIITDNGYEIQKLLKIIRYLDVSTQQPKLEVLRPRYRDAGDIIEPLKQILKGDDTAPKQVIDKVIHDQRTNSIIVFGSQKTIEHAQWFVKKIDTLDHSHENTKTVRIVPIYFSNAQKVAETLRALPKLTGGKEKDKAKIEFDADTNSLLFAADAKDFRQINKLIRKLDVRRNQVLIETVFLEVKSDNNFRMGSSTLAGAKVQGNNKMILGWEAAPVAPLAVSLGDKETDATKAQAAIASMTDLSVGVFGPEVEVSGLKISPAAFLQMLERDAQNRIYTKPVVFGSENEETKISVGQTLFFKSAETDTTGLTNTSTQKEKIDVSVSIKPTVNGSNYVTLALDLEFNLISGIRDGYPEIANRKSKQTITLRDNQMGVISGMNSYAVFTEHKKVPFLSELPLLGLLFSRTERNQSESQILIFVKPHIIVTPKDLNEVFARKLKEAENFSERWFGESLKENPQVSERTFMRQSRQNESFKYSEEL